MGSVGKQGRLGFEPSAALSSLAAMKALVNWGGSVAALSPTANLPMHNTTTVHRVTLPPHTEKTACTLRHLRVILNRSHLGGGSDPTCTLHLWPSGCGCRVGR